MLLLELEFPKDCLESVYLCSSLEVRSVVLGVLVLLSEVEFGASHL